VYRARIPSLSERVNTGKEDIEKAIHRDNLNPASGLYKGTHHCSLIAHYNQGEALPKPKRGKFGRARNTRNVHPNPKQQPSALHVRNTATFNFRLQQAAQKAATSLLDDPITAKLISHECLDPFLTSTSPVLAPIRRLELSPLG
jgi:hypothetical protein